MTKQIPQYEKPSYDAFMALYQQLAEIKNNRNKFISSKQVYSIYDQFLKEVHELSLVRKDEELKGMNLNPSSPLDSLIDDIWQLLSLCFVTCGLIKFAPATYSSLAAVYKLLTHLKECQVYSIDDLKPIRSRLDEIKDIIDRSEDVDDDEVSSNDAIDHKREEHLLLRNKWSKCQSVFNDIENSFNRIPDDLEDVYSQLIAIRKAVLQYLTNRLSDDSVSETSPGTDKLKISLEKYKAMLKEIESQRDSTGRFHSKVASEEQMNSTQRVLNGLLDDCHNLIQDLSIQLDATGISSLLKGMVLDEEGHDYDDKTKKEAQDIFHGVRKVFDDLLALKQTLEQLLVTRRWTMRETDLWGYQKSLKTLDESRLEYNRRIEGNITGPLLKKLQRSQLLVLYLLRRCYALIYKLLESSEPVSESLQPIHNQLSTVRRCLLDIKRIDGLNNLRELFPFQFKLASLDNLKEDGKFIVNGQVPEGQGTLSALLAECFDIIHELKIELEEKEENEGVTNSGLDDDHITDDEDKESDDEVELKRNRYAGLTEADYDIASECDSLGSISDSGYESNDYY